MSGRKSVGNLNGVYTKEEIEYRKEQEKKVNGECNKVTVPPFLKDNKIAIKEFKKLVKELKEREMLSNIDSIQLGMYCQLYATYCECVLLEKEKGLFQNYTNKAGETNLVEAPWIKLKRATETQMINIAKSFGFTPVDRLKFTIPSKVKAEDDPVLKALQGD